MGLGDTVTSMASSVVIPKQSIYEVSTTQQHRIGARLQLGERVFYYARAGTVALNPAVMMQKLLQVADHTACACPTSSAIGDKFIWITLGATLVTLNMYAEGYIHVSDATTKFAMKIKSHLAAAGAAAVKINLYDPIPAVVTAASSILNLSKNPWADVVVVPNGGQTAMAVGVPLIAVPIGNYFWCQTWGPAPLGIKGVVVAADGVAIGGTTDGFCGPHAYADAAHAYHQSWGTPIVINADTKTGLIFLTIAP